VYEISTPTHCPLKNRLNRQSRLHRWSQWHLYDRKLCCYEAYCDRFDEISSLDYATYGITVNAIAPGPVKTSILKQAIDAGAYSEESIADLLPVKRMGELMDIARGIKFSLESKFTTGMVLSVDGGFGA
jgi:hypothetical protein